MQNPTVGGLVNIHSNVAGDIKRVEYDINDALESGGSALDGLRAIAPNANYQLTVPSSNASISFPPIFQTVIFQLSISNQLIALS